MARTFEENMMLSAEELRKEIGEKKAAFVENLLANKGNATLAAVQAGYSERSAACQASRLLKDMRIAAYRRKRAAEIYAAVGVTAETLALELEEIKARCMEGKPHLSWDSDAKEWVEDGTWVFDVKGAISAIKTQADIMGVAAPQKVNLGGEGLEDFLAKLGGGRKY